MTILSQVGPLSEHHKNTGAHMAGGNNEKKKEKKNKIRFSEISGGSVCVALLDLKFHFFILHASLDNNNKS